MPVSASLRRATAFSRSARTAATFAWTRPCDERAIDAARLLDLLEQRPCRVAERASEAFEPAGAGGRVGDLGEVRFLEKDELGVARDAPRKCVRQADRSGMRQHGDGVGAAEAGSHHRHGRAQHVHVRIALGHHAPRRRCCDEGWPRRQSAGLLDPRPQRPYRAEFRRGQELVGVGGEAEIDHASRLGERRAALFERAQIGERDRDHEGELLRLRSAGIVNGASIGHRKWPAIALTSECADLAGDPQMVGGP